MLKLGQLAALASFGFGAYTVVAKILILFRLLSWAPLGLYRFWHNFASDTGSQVTIYADPSKSAHSKHRHARQNKLSLESVC